MKVWSRLYQIRIGDLDITGLRASFVVKRTTKATPNTCSLELWNPSPQTIKEICSPKTKLPIAINAGYEDGTSLIYLGEVRNGIPSRDGADVVVSMSTGDGEKEIQTARLTVPVGPKTPANVVLPNIVKSLGLKMGNTAAAAAKLAKNQPVLYPVATVLDGNAWQALQDFCDAAELECSVQDGAVQILPKGDPLDERPYIISENTGLQGTPAVDYDGSISFTCAMLPGIRPAIRVQLETEFVSGLYRLDECTYTGDTWGDDWKIDCTIAKPKKK